MHFLWKMELKFPNAKFNHLCIIAYIFDVNKDPLELRGQRDHSGTNKIIWIGLCFNSLISYEAKTMHKISSKIVSEIVSENILIKILSAMICIYYLSFLLFFIIYLQSLQKYFLQLEHDTERIVHLLCQ